MRPFAARHFFIYCVAACAMPIAAGLHAADSDAPPPPELQQLDEGEPPAVTIRKPEAESRITEKRARGGKVTEVQVTNGQSTYYLKPNEQVGSAVPGDAESSRNRGAQWKIKEFDWSQDAKEKQARQTAGETPPPPAPAPSDKK